MDLPFSLLFRKWSTWFRFYIEQFFVVFVSLFLYPKKEHLFISHNQPIVNMYRIRHQMCNSTSYFSNIVASVSFVFVLVVRSLDMSQSDLQLLLAFIQTSADLSEVYKLTHSLTRSFAPKTRNSFQSDKEIPGCCRILFMLKM